MKRRNRAPTLKFHLAIALGTAGACLTTADAQSEPSALYVIQGQFYRYTWPASTYVTEVFGPAFGSYNDSYDFDFGGASDRSVTSELGLSSTGGLLEVNLFNESYLRARRLDGNNHGGGFTTSINVYVKGPPGTPYYVERSLSGFASVLKGTGFGTTQAKMANVTALLTNGGTATQSLPVSIEQQRSFAGTTGTSAHPLDSSYHLATTYSIEAWGNTYQAIDICFGGCPALMDFRATSELSGFIEAGPCIPQDADLNNWRSERNNCFNYAINRLVGRFTHPGGSNVYVPFKCSTLEAALASEGIVRTTASGEGCGPGSTVVALVLDPDTRNDYHLYRLNGDGTWSHKPGKRWATIYDTSGLLITNPEIADRRKTCPFYFGSGECYRPGYTVFCGYYCVPCDFEPTIPPPSGSPGLLTEDPTLRAELLVFSGLENPDWLIESNVVLQEILDMVQASAIIDAVPLPDTLGYTGFFLTPENGLVGFPDLIDVFDGVIRTVDDGIETFRADTNGLESFLFALAIEAGFGDIIVGPGCPADYNGSPDAGDIIDFLDFMDDFGSCTNLPAPCGQFGNPDINGDTIVDIVDFLDFIDAFSRGC